MRRAFHTCLAAVFVACCCCALRAVVAWREGPSRDCPPGCEATGNCNRELGVCECNLGWAGPSCQEALLGACRSSNSSSALPMYGMRWPKSCECWRQILR